MATLDDLPVDLKYMIIDELSVTHLEVTDTCSSPPLLALRLLGSSSGYTSLTLFSPPEAPRQTRSAEEFRQICRFIEQGTPINDLASLAKVNKTFRALVEPYIVKIIAKDIAGNTARRFLLHANDLKDLGVFLRKLNPIGRSRIERIYCHWNMDRKDDEATVRTLTDATIFALVKKYCPKLLCFSVYITNLSALQTKSWPDLQYDFEAFDEIDGFKQCLELEQSLKGKEGEGLVMANMATMESADVRALLCVLNQAREGYGLSP